MLGLTEKPDSSLARVYPLRRDGGHKVMSFMRFVYALTDFISLANLLI